MISGETKGLSGETKTKMVGKVWAQVREEGSVGHRKVGRALPITTTHIRM